jgi:hypothetical protein
LLALCLTIPLCWQTSAERAKKRDAERAADDYGALTATLGGNFVPIAPVDRYRGFGSQLLLGDDGIDTLDELLFQLANRPGGIASMASTICCTVWRTMARPHCGQ